LSSGKINIILEDILNFKKLKCKRCFPLYFFSVSKNTNSSPYFSLGVNQVLLKSNYILEAMHASENP
jgi:hypothetical protein